MGKIKSLDYSMANFELQQSKLNLLVFGADYFEYLLLYMTKLFLVIIIKCVTYFKRATGIVSIVSIFALLIN